MTRVVYGINLFAKKVIRIVKALRFIVMSD